MIQWIKDKSNLLLLALGLIMAGIIRHLSATNGKLRGDIENAEEQKEIDDAKEDLSRAHESANDAQSEYERIRDQYRKDNL
jgi:hypothetical protein